MLLDTLYIQRHVYLTRFFFFGSGIETRRLEGILSQSENALSAPSQVTSTESLDACWHSNLSLVFRVSPKHFEYVPVSVSRRDGTTWQR